MTGSTVPRWVGQVNTPHGGSIAQRMPHLHSPPDLSDLLRSHSHAGKLLSAYPIGPMTWWKKATISSVIITLLIALGSYALVQRNAARFQDPVQRDRMDTKAGEVAGQAFVYFNGISWGIFWSIERRRRNRLGISGKESESLARWERPEGADGANSSKIEVAIEHNPLAFFYEAFIPTVTINGEKGRKPWGTHVFIVPPGDYEVAVSYPWIIRECGKNSVRFSIAAGDSKRVKYCARFIRFWPGAISVSAVS